LSKPALLAGSRLGKAVAQEFRQLLFDLRRDEADAVEVLNVYAILETVAGELHADEIGDGGEQDAFAGLAGRRCRDGFRIKMDGGAGAGSSLVDEHVDTPTCRKTQPAWRTASMTAGRWLR
jgi:hypothetical protein